MTTVNKKQITRNNGSISRDLVLNAMLARGEFLSRLMDPRRDIDKECNYPTSVTAEDYYNLYKDNGLCARIVELYPQECWAFDPEVYETERQRNTKFEKEWMDLEEEFNLYSFLQQADEMSGIGSFGIILLGIDDGKDLGEPAEGINEKGERVGTGSGRKLLYLRCFDQHLVQVKKLETDKTNPRYGLPTEYEVTLVDPEAENALAITSQNQTKVLVHWTRVVHLADNILSSQVYGRSRLEKERKRVWDLNKLLGGSAEMFWRGAFPGLSIEMLPELAKEGGAELDIPEIKKQVSQYSEGLQRYMALAGVTAKSLAPGISEPTAHIMAQLQHIALSQGCPLRIFLGSEEAKLASSQDSRTWNKRVMRRQNKYISPRVIRPFVNRLMDLGCLMRPNGDKFYTYWPDLNEPTGDDLATTAGKLTEALAKYIGGNVGTIVPPLEFYTIFLKMPLKEAKALVKAAEKQLRDVDDDPESDNLPTRLLGPSQAQEQERQDEQFEREAQLRKETLASRGGDGTRQAAQAK